MKKKKYKGYVSLKEARAVARDMTTWYYTDIYQESDNSYSVGQPKDKKAKYLMSIDKSGARYIKQQVNHPYYGSDWLEYVKIK